MFSSSAVPPKLKPASLAGFAVGLLALAWLPLAAVVFCFNPSTHAFYPVCQFHQLTGWNCPSCGATRGLYALLHGDWRTALRDNALMLASMVLLPLRGAWWLRKNSGGAAGSFFPAAWLWPMLAVLLVFGVLRNLPAFAFLSPA